jgi:aminomethyltransferase
VSGETAYNRTLLYNLHVEAGAKMVEFGGWLMPVQYRGILSEHRKVREATGVFDVSHMGRLFVTGADAGEFLNSVATNDVVDLAIGQVRYSLVCNREGGVKDDMLISRLDDEEYLLVPNAANRVKILQWLDEIRQDFRGGRADIDFQDRTLETIMIAVQGPTAAEVLQPLAGIDLTGLKPFQIARGPVMGAKGLVSRTGYTGGDGFEVVVSEEAGIRLWRRFMEEASYREIALAGLGARDTLRLEAGLPLYGQDLDEAINPLEAGLGRFVKMEKSDFIGRAALARVAENGPEMNVVGLQVEDGAIARHGAVVLAGGRVAGSVTSGGFSPTLQCSIAMALIAAETAKARTPLSVIVRGNAHLSHVVDLPFFHRRRRK